MGHHLKRTLGLTAKVLAMIGVTLTLGLIWPLNARAAFLPAPDSVTSFGARCDGSTYDDSPGVQAEVNVSAANGWFAIAIPGMCNLVEPVIINRPVLTESSELQFVRSPGASGPAGFVTSQPINMFDSTLSYSSCPVGISLCPLSERVGFYGLTFRVTSASVNAYVMSPKFLRVNFDDDNFENIKLAEAGAGYFQSWHLKDNFIRNYTGTFLHSTLMYDSDSTRDHFEGIGGPGIVTSSASEFRMLSDIYEAGPGPLFKTDIAFQVNVSGTHSESVTGPTFIFAGNGGVSRGVVFMGNYMAQPPANLVAGFYPVITGPIQAMAAGGNWTNGNLYDDSGDSPNGLISLGDTAGDGGTGFVLNASGKAITASIIAGSVPGAGALPVTGTGSLVKNVAPQFINGFSIIGTGTGNSTGWIYYTPLATGNTAYFPFGVSNTANNQALLGFVNLGGTGSSTNYAELGLPGDPMMTIDGTGKVTAPILTVTGAASAASYSVGGVAGVSCAAGTVSLSTLTFTNGIPTHC